MPPLAAQLYFATNATARGGADVQSASVVEVRKQRVFDYAVRYFTLNPSYLSKTAVTDASAAPSFILTCITSPVCSTAAFETAAPLAAVTNE